MISTHDRGFLYGDGVFETVRYCNGNLLLWHLHRERLLTSCNKLAIPLDTTLLDQRIADSIARPLAPDCILKVIVTRGEGGRGYAPPETAIASIVLQWHELPQGIQQASERGIDGIYCDHPLSVNPVTAGLKHLNRLDQVMASIQWTNTARIFPTIKEGLMCDPEGHVVEGTRTNIFAVINNKLCTPDMSRAGVAGVMRHYLTEQFRVAGMPVDVRPIFKHELNLASELFVCNSVSGVWPVTRILQVRDGKASIQAEFASRVMSDFAINQVLKLVSI